MKLKIQYSINEISEIFEIFKLYIVDTEEP